MTNTSEMIEPAPVYEGNERDDLRCLDFLIDELGKLHTRGLLDDNAHATAAGEAEERREPILRRGRARAWLVEAKRLAGANPDRAEAVATRAREADPSWEAAWEFAVDLERKRERLEEAVALCEEAAQRFPAFPRTAESIRAEFAAREAEDTLPQARAALQSGDDRRVIELCSRRLAGNPEHVDSLVLLAFALQRLGRLPEALTAYKTLARLQPGNDVWRTWVATVSKRLGDVVGTRPGPVAARVPDAVKPAPVVLDDLEILPATPAVPRVSFGEVAGEFLLEHWQKLILCMAVLLIVVSSNFAASQLLGPRIWSPAGKCVLGLVYTAMFAAFGSGLGRWGASRAGRIMLFTTLIVVPANFMLAGEMRLLATEPTAASLALLAVDAAMLFLMIRGVVWTLGIVRGAWMLSAWYFVLSGFNAVASTDSPWPEAWRLALFFAPAGVFLAAVAWLTGRYRAATPEGQREVTYGALGLFAFAFLTGVARTGGFVLHLPPALYALPATAGGVACVVAALRAHRFDPDPRNAAWLRLGGLAVTALAFALALARPPEVSAVLSGNTLAVALTGLVLYAAMLRRVRHPAYLYLSFAALFVAYFGAFYFVRDLVHAVEEAARAALGYNRPLPLPFKAINGLAFNSVLALLAVFFKRRWQDDRLAWHAHAIGLPFAAACAVFSMFEPKAAVICLSGYTILAAVAVRLFAEPRLVYFAAATLAGAAYFGVGLVASTTLAEQALIAALIGLGEYLASAVLRVRGVGVAYRRPLWHAAVAMSALAMGGATASAVGASPVALAASGAFLAVTLTTFLANREEPTRALAYLTSLAGTLAFLLFAVYAADHFAGGNTPARLAVAASACALLFAVGADRVWRAVENQVASPATAVFHGPLAHAALVQCGLAGVIGLARLATRMFDAGPAELETLAAAFVAAAGALALVSGPVPNLGVASWSLTATLGVFVCLARALFPARVLAFDQFAAVVGGNNLAMLAGALAVDRFGAEVKPTEPEFLTARRTRLGLFSRALPVQMISLATLAAALAVAGLENTPATVFALAAGAAAVFGAAWLLRSEFCVSLGLTFALFSGMSLALWWANGRPDAVGYGTLTVAVALESALALALALALRQSTGRGALFVLPSIRMVSRLGWVVLAIALVGAAFDKATYRLASPALAAEGLVLLALTTLVRRPTLTYRAVLTFVFALYVVLFGVGTPSPATAHVPGMIAVGLGVLLQAGVLGARPRWGDPEGWGILYFTPALRSALVLTTLGAANSYWSAPSMVLSGVSYLLMVKGLASRRWLYPAVGAWCLAVYAAYLVRLPADRLAPAAVLIGYALWALGMLTRRAEPTLVRWLRLPQAGHDGPLLNLVVVAGFAAAVLRLGDHHYGSVAWADSAALAGGLAGLALLMSIARPNPLWVHLTALFATQSAFLAAYPFFGWSAGTLSVGMALALGWLGASLGAARLLGRVDDLSPIHYADYEETFDLWSRLLYRLSEGGDWVAALFWLPVAVLRAVPREVATHWAGLPVAAGLGAAVVLARSRAGRPARLATKLGGLLLLTAWWLGVPGSPLVRLGWLDGRVYRPFVTAFLGFVAVAVSVFAVRSPAGRGSFLTHKFGTPEDDVRRLDATALQAGFALSVVGAGLAFAAGDPSRFLTFLTLAVATSALALAAVARDWVKAAYASGLLAAAAGIAGGLHYAAQFGVTAGSDRVIIQAVALLGSVVVMTAVAGVARRRGLTSSLNPTDLPAHSAPFAFEQVALVASVFCAAGVFSTVVIPPVPSAKASAEGVAVLMALAAVAVVLVRRWGAVWLVYLAQGGLLGAYLYYRWAFPMPAATDALLLTLIGYLDFGLAEGLHRFGLGRFARPTLHSALAIPLVALGLAALGGPLSSATVFLLFASAAFYSVACVRLSSRPAGYGAAVLLNVALWALWSQYGWTFADRPQFFLIPVGLSAVLFAEVNRGSLGALALNGFRGVGLTVVYLSLAVPVWRFQSFGSWLAMLLLSVLGIFVGIGLRLQTFLWLGLATFFLDVVYQLGRVGMENALAKWGVMLALGIGLVMFVALNEKKQILKAMRGYYDVARQWD